MSLRMVLLALKDAAETASQRCKKPIGRSYDKHVLRVVDDIGRSWFAATGRMVTSSPSGPFDRLLQMLVTKLANDRSARKLIDSTLRRWRTERRESLERWARHKDPRVARIAKAELRRLR